jgi:hypothetical protein
MGPRCSESAPSCVRDRKSSLQKIPTYVDLDWGRSRVDPFRKTNGGGHAHAPGGLLSAMRRMRLKHGGFTAEAIALKREIQALARMTRATMEAIE